MPCLYPLTPDLDLNYPINFARLLITDDPEKNTKVALGIKARKLGLID